MTHSFIELNKTVETRQRRNKITESEIDSNHGLKQLESVPRMGNQKPERLQSTELQNNETRLRE